MKNKNRFRKMIYLLDPEQKKRFYEYIPDKVYHTEKNISILVAATQLCMILLFLINRKIPSQNMRAVSYFALYVFLFAITCAAILMYRYTVKNKKYRTFLWLRRIYAFLLCIWVIGISCLEQMNGNGLTVYCYLLPTTASLLLFNPLESTVIFGSTWIGMACMLGMVGPEGGFFSNTVNSIFVTVLSLFISYRYYRSMAKEFCDRETIAGQYDLLEKLVHTDQLTGLYNRRYLQEIVYPRFEECRKKNQYGIFLMMDIDYFKQYNDTYGHLQGDDCLRKIAEAVKAFCAQEGTFAIRYGGEEFLIIQMAETQENASAFAASMMCRIREADIARADVAQKHVTVSIGLWHNKLRGIDNIEAAIQCADKALYRAKSAGRDRIME